MKLALIDNNDSFTFNIVELLRKMPGCEYSVLSSDLLNAGQLKYFDKIIISPGPGLPDEFPVLEEIIKSYFTEKHFLGICLGHESIAQFFGAVLTHLPAVIHGQPKQIHVQTDSILFRNIPNQFKAGLYHSWVVGKKSFPDELLITALSEDGDIMAVQHKRYKLFGVQFHPESVVTEHGGKIIQNFIET